MGAPTGHEYPLLQRATRPLVRALPALLLGTTLTLPHHTRV